MRRPVHDRVHSNYDVTGTGRGTRCFLYEEWACLNLINCWIRDGEAKRTMTTITIEQAGKYDGQEVTIQGWLYNLRESGKLFFPLFCAGTGVLQGGVFLDGNPQSFSAL